MAPPKKSSAVIVVRAKGSAALPPALIGYNSLVTPDDYDPDKPMFKANFHYDPHGLDLLRASITRLCLDGLKEKLAEAAEKESWGAVKVAISLEDWLEAQLKTPKPEFKVQHPFIRVTTKATGKTRQGEEYTKEIACWDGHNVVLDLKAIKLGVGSLVEPIVTPALFMSKTVNLGAPMPKFYLVGVRVLKLVSYGGSQAPRETDDEAIREALSDPTFQAEDLSAFAKGKTTKPPVPDGEAPPMEGVF